MSSIQDVPNLLLTEGNGILAIPNKLDIETKQVSQQCKQDGHDQGVGNVQIIERVARESRNQKITLAEGGMMKLHQCVNQVDGMKAWGGMACILGNIWGCMQNHITEEMQEVRSLVNEDVQRKLDGMCEMYRVDIRGW